MVANDLATQREVMPTWSFLESSVTRPAPCSLTSARVQIARCAFTCQRGVASLWLSEHGPFVLKSARTDVQTHLGLRTDVHPVACTVAVAMLTRRREPARKLRRVGGSDAGAAETSGGWSQPPKRAFDGGSWKKPSGGCRSQLRSRLSPGFGRARWALAVRGTPSCTPRNATCTPPVFIFETRCRWQTLAGAFQTPARPRN